MTSDRPNSSSTLAGLLGTTGPGVELACIALIGTVAVVVALLGGSPLAITCATIMVGIVVAALLIRVASIRRRSLTSLHQKCDAEVEGWRERWQTLHQEAQQNESALSLMRDGVIMLSDGLEIMLINPAARRLLNLSADQDAYGRPFGEIVRIPDLSRAVAAARAGEGTQKILVEISGGEVVRPIKVRIDRFSTSGQNSLLLSLRDETEAHRVDEMRREFVANISHELKTPLAAIKGYAETVELAIKDDPDAAVHFMTQIHSQCLRLERLISDMMQLARAQSGRSVMKIGSVAMREVIDESLKSYQPVAEANQITLTVDPPDEATVRSDPEATLTIANNLIGNAIQHTPEGGKVRIYCRPAGQFWALVVEDTGVGISATDQKRVFERFYRVERSRSTDDGGTGIGLSIVKNLAMTLGGEVRLTSRPGEGSKFEVLLPRAAAEFTKHS